MRVTCQKGLNGLPPALARWQLLQSVSSRSSYQGRPIRHVRGLPLDIHCPFDRAEPGPHLRSELERSSTPELLRELAEADPVGYEQIDHNNRRRIVRAVEIVRLTCKPFSLQRADWRLARRNESESGPPRLPCDGLNPARERASARIHPTPGPCSVGPCRRCVCVCVWGCVCLCVS